MTDYETLVQEWTRMAQNASISDTERHVYYACADRLHQLNIKHLINTRGILE
jgi:hypothetical protein